MLLLNSPSHMGRIMPRGSSALNCLFLNLRVQRYSFFLTYTKDNVKNLLKNTKIMMFSLLNHLFYITLH